VVESFPWRKALPIERTRLSHDRFNLSFPGKFPRGGGLGFGAFRGCLIYVCLIYSGVTCPFCGHIEDKVIDSRESKEGDSIRRRRQCLQCEKRFTTYERIDEVPYMVIKKDGRREKFDRQKVLNGLLKSCEKRPISMVKLSDLVNQVEARVTESPDREITTTEIGEYLMDTLRGIDKIAYVRFASVYRDFQDEQAFLNELKSL
jgi:transcriptional repressor NrdR